MRLKLTPGAATKYAINIAGILYNLGNALQFIFGMIAHEPVQIASALFLVAASSSFMFFGHKKFGVPIGCMLAFLGVGLAAWPGLIKFEAGTWFGVMALSLSVFFGIFSSSLRNQYRHHKSKFVAATLGHPRRAMGLTALILSRLPIIIENALHERWESFLVFTIWAVADCISSLSDTGKTA